MKLHIKNYFQTIQEEIYIEFHEFITKNNDVKNGYYKRYLTYQGITKIIKIPRARNNKFNPHCIRYNSSLSQADYDEVIKLQSMGISSRRIEQELNISKSLICKLKKDTLLSINDFKNSDLSNVNFDVIYLDATYFRVANKQRKSAVLMAFGYNIKSNQKTLLGIEIGDSEQIIMYQNLIDSLKNRNLEDIQYFTVDGFRGVIDYLEKIFPNSAKQLCLVHKTRNYINKVGGMKKGLKGIAHILFNDFFKLNNEEQYYQFLRIIQDNLPSLNLMPWYNESLYLTAYYNMPDNLHQHFRSTNMIESYNRVIKKNLKNFTKFPSDSRLLDNIITVLFNNQNTILL